MKIGTLMRCPYCDNYEVRIDFYDPLEDSVQQGLRPKRLKNDPQVERARRREVDERHGLAVKAWRGKMEQALRVECTASFPRVECIDAEDAKELRALLAPLEALCSADTVAVALTTDGRYIYACQSLSSARAAWADSLPEGSQLLALSSGQLCRLNGLSIHAEAMLLFAQWLTQHPVPGVSVLDTNDREIEDFEIYAIVASQPACVHCAILQLLAGIRFDHNAARQGGRYYHDWADPWCDGPLHLNNPFTRQASTAVELLQRAWAQHMNDQNIPNFILQHIMSFVGTPPVCRRPQPRQTKKRKK